MIDDAIKLKIVIHKKRQAEQSNKRHNPETHRTIKTNTDRNLPDNKGNQREGSNEQHN